MNKPYTEDLKPISLYVHWPWCKKKCPYCDFNSHVTAEIPEDLYIEKVLEDLRYQADLIGPRKLVSIFFGGGTPSLMKPESAEKIINGALDIFTYENIPEITLEANPTSSNFEKFKKFADSGINRFSIGVQSLHDEHLQYLGREHSAKEALLTIEHAMNAVDNVNFDLIYGLENQKIDDWHKDLLYAISLGSQHLSAYQLTIEPNTMFHNEHRKGRISIISDDHMHAFYKITRETCETNNYNNYEISNFSKIGFECRHNYNVWQYGEYMGIGAGAHGRIRPNHNRVISTHQTTNPKNYLMNTVTKRTNEFEIDRVKVVDEILMMGLRLKNGITDKLYLSYITGSRRDKLLFLHDKDLLNFSNENISLTSKGWEQLDGILSYLIFD